MRKKNSFKVHLRVPPAVKRLSLSSKEPLPAALLSAGGSSGAHDCCLTEYQEAVLHGRRVARSTTAAVAAAAAPHHPDPLRRVGELAAAIS